MVAQETSLLWEKTAASLKQMEEHARSLVKKLQRGDVLYLFGPLGVGKTAFVRFCIHALVEKDIHVPSPTFTIANVYEGAQCLIWHLDLYRINSLGEIKELGFTESVEESVTFIEWPEKLGPLQDPEALYIFLTEEKEVRTIQCKGNLKWKKRFEHAAHSSP